MFSGGIERDKWYEMDENKTSLYFKALHSAIIRKKSVS